MSSYLDVLKAIEEYYGSGSDQWVEFAKYNIASSEAEQILSQVPNVSIIKNTDGSIRGYNYSKTISVDNTASKIDSNIVAENLKTSVPAEMGVSETAGTVTLKSGLKTAGKFITKEVVPAIAAAGVGITLGKTIDSLLYKANPNFWDSKGMSSLNPETWSSITSGDESFNASLFNMIFCINDDNTTQGYLDENALAYLAYYMQTQGVFSTTSSTTITAIPSGWSIPKITIPFENPAKTVYEHEGSATYYSKYSSKDFIAIRTSVGAGYDTITDVTDTKPSSLLNYYTYDNKTVYFTQGQVIVHGDTTSDPDSIKYDYTYNEKQKIAWLLQFNSKTIQPIDGIGTQTDATTPDLTIATSVDDTLAKLKEQYPSLWENAVENNVVQPDGSVKTYTYIPIAMPDSTSSTDTQPTSGNTSQKESAVNPSTATESFLDAITSYISSKLTPTDNNNDSSTGDGNSPSVIIPSGSANALYTIYNPSQEQLNSFGSWLWSSDFVDQLLKLFNDPMQAIIGLHKVFCPVPVGGVSTIKVGYLDSGVTSNYINNQYVEVNCGNVSVSEFFNNVFDYEPYTKVFIYLPFIGIQELNTGDIMRGTINVTYKCDVLTGVCLAQLTVTRDGYSSVLYTYTGNCAVQYPISSGSYIGIVTSIASVAGSALASATTGGSMLPFAMRAGTSLLNAHTSVAHSGNFSGNAGAMGIKNPYLIITRPQTRLAETFPTFEGYPSNHSVKLNDCNGYVEIESCYVKKINALDNELTQIETLLKTGVIIKKE